MLQRDTGIEEAYRLEDRIPKIMPRQEKVIDDCPWVRKRNKEYLVKQKKTREKRKEKYTSR